MASNPLVAVRPFAEPQPSRRVALAWRVTYPRSGALDGLRRAIFDSELPGARPVGRVSMPEVATRA
jgi:LysR family hydrogen peroxide-inducible transcriptional activator